MNEPKGSAVQRLASWLFLLLFWALPTRAANDLNWAWEDEGPGVTYYCDRNPRLPLVVHVIRIDRSAKDLEFYTTLGGIDRIGMAVISDQVRFIPPSVGKAVAAINGDYFFDRRPYSGDPRTLQILRGGELVSAPGEDRAFFYIDAKGEPQLTNASPAFEVTWPNGKKMPLRFNEAPGRESDLVLLTPAVGTSTRMPGVELIVTPVGDESCLPLHLGQKLSVKVVEVNRSGYSKLTTNRLVISLPPRRLDQLPALQAGMELKISLATDPELQGAVLAIGGGPTLVRGGKVRSVRDYSGFGPRNPRAALGWNDRYYFLVQADGRQPRYSMGMTLTELANYFVKLGCDSALNLDGGGSSSTWLNGRIINKPSEGRERPSANALVIVRKKS